MDQIPLERPLVCLDLETTGIDVANDRIVQIALIRLEPGGARFEFDTLVDPGVPIPPAATRVHGIRDEDVRGCPTVAQLADRILALLDGADVTGFNSAGFDLPLLANELARAGRALPMEGRRHVDVMRIYHQRERRDLAAAYRLYCGKTLVGAHSALADAAATLEVLAGQFERYADLPRDWDELHRLCMPGAGRFVDARGKLAWNGDGEAVFTFGKHRGVTLRRVVATDPDYLRWIDGGADFAADLRAIVREALAGRFPARARAGEEVAPV